MPENLEAGGRRHAGRFVAVLVLAGAMAPAWAQDAGWTRLVSRPHGVSVSFPSDLIVRESPRQGRYELEGDASVELNVSPLKGEELDVFIRRHVLRNIEVTYRRKMDDWMAYSGYLGSDIVYGRTILSCDGRFAHSFVLTYPAAARATYDRVSERMSLTMRVTDGFERENC